MKDLGLSGVVEVVRDIYTGSTMRIMVGASHSDPISCARGVKQGCPLSPILFNLVVEQLLRGVEDLKGGYLFDEFTLKVLAYADDLCLVANPPEELQALLKRAEEFASWAALRFNIRKCGTLHCNRLEKWNFVAEDTLYLGEQALPILRYKDHYRYLGCDLGADPKAQT